MELSELEGCVLGVICRAEPCTAYFVRKQFRASLTTSWRASTGAIYPLIAKLVRSGLVWEQAVAGDGRGARRLGGTASGRAALEQWVVGRPAWLADPSADAIRTRFQFLDLAGVPRAAMLAAWRSDTLAAMTRVTARLAADAARGDGIEMAAHRGALLQIEARLQWLEELAAG